jgi:hypothetical protein
MRILLIGIFIISSCTCYNDEIIKTKKELSDIDFQLKELLKADSTDFDEDQIIFLSIDKSFLQDRLKELESKSNCP